MVRSRRGISKLGCLLSILIVVFVVHFGIQVTEVYWKFFQYQDAMRQRVRFAGRKTNTQIVRELRAKADSLGLPEGAFAVRVRRVQRYISIEAEYYETLELPGFVREVYLNPHAEGTF